MVPTAEAVVHREPDHPRRSTAASAPQRRSVDRLNRTFTPDSAPGIHDHFQFGAQLMQPGQIDVAAVQRETPVRARNDHFEIGARRLVLDADRRAVGGRQYGGTGHFGEHELEVFDRSIVERRAPSHSPQHHPTYRQHPRVSGYVEGCNGLYGFAQNHPCMKGTLLLTVPNTPARPGIVQDFAAAAAIRARLTPLAADRVGRDVAALAESAGAAVLEIAATIESDSLRLALRSDAGWAASAATLPAAHGAVPEGDALVLEFTRPPLQAGVITVGTGWAGRCGCAARTRRCGSR